MMNGRKVHNYPSEECDEIPNEIFLNVNSKTFLSFTMISKRVFPIFKIYCRKLY